MTKRFFKAQIGDKTFFRATGRVYASAQIARFGLTFSSKPAALGWSPAVEITKAEYNQLTALKQARMIAAGEVLQGSTSPQDSWVRNDEIGA